MYAYHKEHPEAGERLAVIATSEEVRALNSKRMKENNPMCDPETRERASAALRGRKFSGQRGGNGQITPQQCALAERLGWEMEYPIPTGVSNWPAAVVDIANPDSKIAVEVDGGSHQTKKQKNRDRRKERMLKKVGWTVLRFWNSQVDENIEEVLAAIAQFCL
jgi:hypothetical protein